MEKYMTCKDYASKSGLPLFTIQKACRNGYIRFCKIGKAYYIDTAYANNYFANLSKASLCEEARTTKRKYKKRLKANVSDDIEALAKDIDFLLAGEKIGKR